MAFNSSRVVTLDGLADLVDQEDRINKCIDEYIKTQSKSYNKIVQNNLYDLIYNFGRITSKIYGKKQDNIDMPYEDKIEILAKAQCEAYNAINKSK